MEAKKVQDALFDKLLSKNVSLLKRKKNAPKTTTKKTKLQNRLNSNESQHTISVDLYSDSNDSTSKESEKVDWRAEAKNEKKP